MKPHLLLALLLSCALLRANAAAARRATGRITARRRKLGCPTANRSAKRFVKADYKKNLEDAAELAQLAEELKADLEKDDRYVVSVKTMKKTGGHREAGEATFAAD